MVERVGPYTLVRELGRGGMGHVHLGRRDAGDGPALVAIKRMTDMLFGDPKQRELFLREARIAGRIRHPNVVRTLEAIAEAETIYHVMEYVDGVSLLSLLATVERRGIVVDVSTWVRIFVDTLRGIGGAFEARDELGRPLHVVHRDISPPNILIGRDGVARVGDFGIAKTATHQTTQDSAGFKGKVRYVAPEQISGAPAAHASDIYSACVVAWEMLAGVPLFRGETNAVTLTRVLLGKIPSLREHNAAVSDALEGLVRAGLSTDPKARPASASALADDVERAGPVAPHAAVAELVDAVLAEGALAPASEPTHTATVSRGSAQRAPRDLEGAPSQGTVVMARPVVRTPEPRQAVAGNPVAGSSRALAGSAAGLVVIVVIGVGGWLAHARSRASSTSIVTGPSSPTLAVPALTAPALTAPALTAVASTVTEPSSVAASPIPSSSSAEPSAGGRVRARVPSRSKPKVDCTVPTFLDEHGVQRIRKECLDR